MISSPWLTIFKIILYLPNRHMNTIVTCLCACPRPCTLVCFAFKTKSYHLNCISGLWLKTDLSSRKRIHENTTASLSPPPTVCVPVLLNANNYDLICFSGLWFLRMAMPLTDGNKGSRLSAVHSHSCLYVCLYVHQCKDPD